MEIIDGPQNMYFASSLKIFELIPKDRVQALLDGPNLWEENREEDSGGYWKYEVDTMKKLMKQIKRDDLLAVRHHNSKYTKYGRKYANCPSLANMRRIVRNTLCTGIYADLDIYFCHASLLLSMSEKPTWKKVWENREESLELIQKLYPEADKQWITSLLYNKQVVGLDGEEGIVSNLIKERDEWMDEVWKAHCKNKFWKSWYQSNKEVRNDKGKFMSLYLQELETRLVDSIIECLDKETQVLMYKGSHVFSYEYDGFKILMENLQEGILDFINEKASSQYKYIRFVNKPMKECYELDLHKVENEKFKSMLRLADGDICDILLDEVGTDNLIYHNKSWYYFDGKKWIFNEEITPHELKVNLKEILIRNGKRVMRNDESTLKKYLARVDEIMCKNKNCDSALAKARSFFNRQEVHFNENPMLLGFNNGVYDLNAMEFRDYRHDDYITFSCGYNYENVEKEQREELEEVLRKIQPCQELYELWMSCYGSALCGLNVDKLLVLNGEGGNGKGTGNKIMRFTLGPDYSSQVNPKMITQPTRQGPNPMMAQLNLKRFVCIEEPDENDRLQNSTIKTLTGGSSGNDRSLFSNKCSWINNMTLVLECNSRLELSAPPKYAEHRRLIDLEFASSFKEEIKIDNEETRQYVANKKYITDEWGKEQRLVMFHLCLEYFKKWKENEYNFNIPEDVKKRSQSYLNECNPIHKLFYDMTEEKEGEKASIKQLYDDMKLSPAYRNDMKYSEKRFVNMKNFQKFLKDENIKVEDEMILGRYTRRNKISTSNKPVELSPELQFLSVFQSP
jgi:phage/plasmid-associated DNA primase